MLFSKFIALSVATAVTVLADKLEPFKGGMQEAGVSPFSIAKFNKVFSHYGRSDNFFVTTTELLTKYARDWDFPVGHPDDWAIIDLRSADEYKAQHIRKAISYPVTVRDDQELEGFAQTIRMANRETLPKALQKMHYKKYVVFLYEKTNRRSAEIASAYLEYVMRNGKAGITNSLEKQNIVLLMGSYQDVVKTSQRLKKEGKEYLDFDPDLRTPVSRRWLPKQEW
ncbi:hypothetical protein H072_44 [Dactylellina haptotyla CBS 200.50]|uniref:Rhodanese domain-containing protein n=1 Tax=Dactylellina haptotyla (strain CBS 200.50) TaxID=1284197 RepID=S8AY79_DACHA|nr:hypothetical protein H072_44 [Dactylellina haptotyla CBS 200.50]